MTRPFFSRDRITHFELFDRNSAIAIDQMKHRFSSGYSVDFQEAMARFTMDSSTEFLFGACVDSLKSELPYPHYAVGKNSQLASSGDNGFAHAFLHAQDRLAKRSAKRWIWPLFEIWKDATEEHMKVVRAFIEPIVEAALEKKKRVTTSGAEKKNSRVDEQDTLLDHLVNETSGMSFNLTFGSEYGSTRRRCRSH